MGADHAINYKTHDFAAEVKRITDGKGVNVFLDMVAGSYIAKEVECMAEDGRLVIIAVQGGVKSEFNAGMVLRKRLTITGSTLRPRTDCFQGSHCPSFAQNGVAIAGKWRDQTCDSYCIFNQSSQCG